MNLGLSRAWLVGSLVHKSRMREAPVLAMPIGLVLEMAASEGASEAYGSKAEEGRSGAGAGTGRRGKSVILLLLRN